MSDSPLEEPSFRLSFYVGTGARIGGLLVLTFHAANAVTIWIPSSWTVVGLDGEQAWAGGLAQLIIGLCFFAVASDALTKLEANAHRLIRPTRWRLLSWATRGYDRAQKLIEEAKVARPSDIDLTPGYLAMEFFQGFDIRLAEEGDSDARQGRYRPAAFEDRDAYIEAWRQSVTRLRMSGWCHPQLEQALEKLESARKAEATARDKEYWKSALGFDPDEVLKES